MYAPAWPIVRFRGASIPAIKARIGLNLVSTRSYCFAIEKILRVSVPCMILLNPLCSFFLSRTSDLSNHNDTLSSFIMLKYFESVNKVRSGQRVSTHTNHETLANAGPRRRCNRLVTKRTRFRYDSCSASLESRQWMKSNPTSTCGWYHSGRIGAYQAALWLRLEHCMDLLVFSETLTTGNERVDLHEGDDAVEYARRQQQSTVFLPLSLLQ